MRRFLVILSVVLPLALIVPWALAALFKRLPQLALPGISHLIVGACIVGLMIDVIMPPYTRAVSKWLFG